MAAEFEKIMMVGVLPPPVHGQSLATQALFDADLSPLQKITIGIHSSKELSAVGKPSLRKALGLISLIGKTWLKWLHERPRVLYYTAGSGAWTPFFRDVVFLTLCRPLFRKTVIHYHSGNLVEFLSTSKLKNFLGRLAYGRGSWTIRLGTFCPAPAYPSCKVFDVPNGIDAPEIPSRSDSESFRILFLGNLFEDKGIVDLVKAVGIFSSRHTGPITLTLVGNWPDEQTREKVKLLLSRLPQHVTVPEPGPAFGAAKWNVLANHDVLAFPSYYSSENLPLVLIEGMAASLPVIATDWRGIRSLVEDGKTGMLVAPHDVEALASALEKISADPDLRKALGAAGRARYEQSLTANANIRAMRQVLSKAARNN